ncbi:MAG: hypothetical protein AAGG81_02205 [Chlamydiota bacterium]
MSFEIKNILKGAEVYRDFDYNNNKDQKEAKSFPEISEIITKWSPNLFPEKFINDYQFSLMGSMVQDEIKKEEKIDQRMSKTAMNLHRVTYQSLVNNGAPTEEDLSKVTKVFKDFVDSIEEAKHEPTKKEFVQLSLHPRTAMLCSEAFFKHVAEQVGEGDTFNFNIEKLLDEKLSQGMKSWTEVAFKPEFATKDGFAELESGVYRPYFRTTNYKFQKVDLSLEDSLNGAVKYLASIALKHMDNEKPTDEELISIKNVFDEMFNHFERLQTGEILYTSKREAKEALEEAEKAYNNHVKESIDRKNELTLTHQNAVKEHKEAVDASMYYNSLEEVLATEVKIREEIVNATKKNLDDTVEADKKKNEELDQTMADAKAKFNEMDNLAHKRGEVAENLAIEVNDETFDMITSVSQNLPQAIDFMQKYLRFAKARAERELKEDSSFLSKFLGK